jgi:hypothetical protein
MPEKQQKVRHLQVHPMLMTYHAYLLSPPITSRALGGSQTCTCCMYWTSPPHPLLLLLLSPLPPSQPFAVLQLLVLLLLLLLLLSLAATGRLNSMMQPPASDSDRIAPENAECVSMWADKPTPGVYSFTVS